ncbi:MAG: hypothetical protein ABFC57_10820 [Veillonellales bacterium]
MGKDEVKAVTEILGNKTKFKRASMIIGMVLLALIVISAIACYTGAFKWVIK